MFRLSRDVAQSGRAPRSGRGGRWFKSSRPDHPHIMAFERWVFIIIVVRSFPVGPDVKNVQKSDRRFFPRLSKSSNRGVVAFSDDRRYTRNRFPFWHRAHRCNYTFQGSSPDYIPWFYSSPHMLKINPTRMFNRHFAQTDDGVF